jgi:hypothetical protein
MEEAPENGKESSHSAHANRVNERMNKKIGLSFSLPGRKPPN